jgi:hypothetical protein
LIGSFWTKTLFPSNLRDSTPRAENQTKQDYLHYGILDFTTQIIPKTLIFYSEIIMVNGSASYRNESSYRMITLTAQQSATHSTTILNLYYALKQVISRMMKIPQEKRMKLYQTMKMIPLKKEMKLDQLKNFEKMPRPS